MLLCYCEFPVSVSNSEKVCRFSDPMLLPCKMQAAYVLRQCRKGLAIGLRYFNHKTPNICSLKWMNQGYTVFSMDALTIMFKRRR